MYRRKLYSLGYLDGPYVRYFDHEEYEMKITVNDSVDPENGACWEKLKSPEKTELLGQKIKERIELLLVGDKKNNTWQVCFSRPDENGLPDSASLLSPTTPGYSCLVSTAVGAAWETKALPRDRYLVFFRAFLIIVGVVTMVAQFFAVPRAISLVRRWGVQDDHKRASRNQSTKCIRPRKDYFSVSHLPAHVTVGGLLNDPNMLGPRCFFRLKVFLLIIILVLLNVFLPVYLASNVFNPQSNPGEKKLLLYRDTFGKCEQSIYGSVVPMRIYGIVIFSICFNGIVCATVFVGLFNGSKTKSADDLMNRLLEATRSPLRWSHFVVSFFMAILRVLLSTSIFGCPASASNTNMLSATDTDPATNTHPATSTHGQRNVNCCTTKCLKEWFCKFCNLVLWFVGSVVTLTLSVLILAFEVAVMILMFLLLPGVTVHWSLRGSDILKWVFSIAIVLSMPWFIFLFYIVGVEVSTFFLLTFVGFYLDKPVAAFVLTSWIVSSVIEFRNVLDSYRAPLLSIWTVHIKEVKEVIESSGDKGLVSMLDEQIEHDTIRLKSKVNQLPGEWIDWKVFLDEADAVYDLACYRVLKDSCPDSPVALFCQMCSSCNLHTAFDLKRDKVPLVWFLRCFDAEHSPSSDNALKNDRKELVQFFLCVKLLNELVKYFAFLAVLVMILLLVFAFNGLWNDHSSSGLRELNSIIYVTALVPLFTYYRSKIGSPPLDDNRHILVKHIVKEGVRAALRKAEKNVGIVHSEIEVLNNLKEGLCAVEIKMNVWRFAFRLHQRQRERETETLHKLKKTHWKLMEWQKVTDDKWKSDERLCKISTGSTSVRKMREMRNWEELLATIYKTLGY